MTNGDRIRGMSDKELAWFLLPACPPGKPGNCPVNKKWNESPCKACWLYYLRNDADEVEENDRQELP